MGFHGFSPVSLLLTLLIVVLLFGTRRLRDVGRDLGEAVKSFRDGMQSSEENKPLTPPAELSQKDKSI